MKQIIETLKQDFEILAEIDLNQWDWANHYDHSQEQLQQVLKQHHKETYENNQRLIFTLTQDLYVPKNSAGLILRNLQLALNQIDISNFFAVVVSTNTELHSELLQIQSMSSDKVPVAGHIVEGKFSRTNLSRQPVSKKDFYRYGSLVPTNINIEELTYRERFLLTKSNTFCMYPWTHIHAFPNGQTYLCCESGMEHPIGDAKQNTLNELWNSDTMKQIRINMLSEQKSAACNRCYEKEESGFFSGRKSANKHHGHHIARVNDTQADGTYNDFKMTYWDIRFSNLCNLRCRSCGPIFSSQWYQDQARLAGPEWAKTHQVLNYAGRTEMDMWEQLEPHLDYVEQIYFAGGEPLLMEEHYRILDELDRRGLYHVRLIYNTNFTHTDLKGRSVFDYWKKFNSVSVGASLDDSGTRGELIRKGIKWDTIEQNRRDMQAICPQVDFYISPTLSILNAWHLPDFHRDWVERGFIRAQDLNVNILQDPEYLRIDIAPQEYKDRLATKYLNHILWLRDKDPLTRATVGFESAIKFMMSTDNTQFIKKFWERNNNLDNIRNEHLLDVIPELSALK